MSESPEPTNIEAPDDEVLAHRARLATLVRIAKRIGYGLFAYSVVAFGIGAAVGFTAWLVDSILAALAIGSVLLIPAIVFGYGIRAADREDRELELARRRVADVDRARR